MRLGRVGKELVEAFVFNLIRLEDKPRIFGYLRSPQHVHIFKNLWDNQIWIGLNSSRHNQVLRVSWLVGTTKN